jgi:hypothetical protein
MTSSFAELNWVCEPGPVEFEPIVKRPMVWTRLSPRDDGWFDEAFGGLACIGGRTQLQSYEHVLRVPRAIQTPSIILGHRRILSIAQELWLTTPFENQLRGPGTVRSNTSASPAR